jgi:hypothetical protein
MKPTLPLLAAVSLARAGTMTDLGTLPGGRTTGSGRTLPEV